MPYMWFEEESEEHEGECYYSPEPINITDIIDDIEEYWALFRRRYTYPLYAIFLATEADIEIVTLITHYRSEIAEMSGEDCCFVYFRDIEKAKNLIPFSFSEHARRIYPLARLLEIDIDLIPSILFFENLFAGEYVLFDLRDKSVNEIIELQRHLFSYLRQRSRGRPLKNPLRYLKSFARARRVSVTRDTLIRNAVQLSRSVLIEVLKSLVKIS